jgi:pimeloyl-ACP methyl ester carboxylesterase
MRLSAPLALLVAAGLLLAAPAAGAAVAYSPCSQGSALQCGSLDVPLDRGGAITGTVRLVAVRKPAPSNPTNTAVLGLAGGPGQSAIPLVSDFAELLAPALATRDLLMFDQRGTGVSSPLRCSLAARTLTLAGRRCASEIGPSRGQFTTTATVEDIEALRAESGYDKLVIYGVSYGTKVALDYAARYPDRVAGLVLDSVVLPDGPDPLQRSTFAAMRRVLAELCAGSECSGISAHPAADLAGRVRSLSRKPLHGLLTNARGVREPVEIERGDLFDVLLNGDLNPTLRAELPGALTSARHGDSAPLIRIAARSAGIISLRRQAAGNEFSDAVFASTLCEEGNFPWDRAAGSAVRSQQVKAFARSLGEGAFRPFDSATALQNDMITLCLDWPVTSPGATPLGPLPDVPTLVIDGGADVRTPLEDANKIRALIPSAQELAVPYTGHSALASDLSEDQCAVRAVRQFFAGQPVTPCGPSDNPFSPTPVAPTRFTRLKPTGRGGKIGRTITAALATAQDMRRQVIGDALEAGGLPRRAAGLRGGRATVHATSLTLSDAVYVPGVKVSGSVPLGSGTQVLRVRGPKAAHGELTITAVSISGRLDGHPISVASRAAAAALPGIGQPRFETLLRRFRLRNAG